MYHYLKTGLKLLLLCDIKAVQIHNLDPSSDEVLNETVLTARRSVDLRDGAKFRVRAEDEIVAGSLPLLLTSLAVLAGVNLVIACLPLGLGVKKVDEEVIGELTRTLGEDTV